MKKLFFIIPFLLLTVICFGQRQRIDSLLKVIENDMPDSTLGRCYYKLGKDFSYINIDSADLFAKKSLSVVRKLNNQKGTADCYSLLGVNAKNSGRYEEALKYHLQSLGIKESLKDETGTAIAYNDIGVLYKTMKRFDEAMVYYKKSNVLCRKIDLAKGISMTYNNIGTIYREKQNQDSALFYYELALKQAESMGDGYSISTCLSNVGDVYFEKDRYKEALAMFTRCISFDRANEDNLGMIYSYNNIARTLAAIKEFPKALQYSDSASNLATAENMQQERLSSIAIRIEIMDMAGDYKTASGLQRQLMTLKDSLMSDETSKNISELQEKYNAEKREHTISLQQSEIKRKNYLIGGIGAFVLMSSLLGYSYYRRGKLRQRAKLQEAIIEQQELATHAVIQAEERERKRIAGDLHDGVGQLMSAAKMNLSMIGSELSFRNEEEKQNFEKVVSLVDEGCREVRTVSHSIMPNALLRSGLASAVREFINMLDQRVIQVNFYAEGLNERIDPNTESVLYRIVQECVNNVIKHAAASQLDISLIKDLDGISVTIEDNGKGFDGSDKNKFSGIGVRNIQSRVEYLKGTVEWDSSPGKGTVVTIQVPSQA